jgi:HSP20 family protein
MTKLSLWNPWRMLPVVRNWDEDWDELVSSQENELDMYEEGNSIIVKVKAPGFKQENIDITIEDGAICVTGKIEEEEEDKKRKYYRKEFRSQSFTRRVDLPVRIQSEKAEAEFKNGVLTLKLPKAEESKSKSIKIKPQG